MPFDDFNPTPKVRPDGAFPVSGSDVYRLKLAGPEGDAVRRRAWENYSTGVYCYYFQHMRKRSWCHLTQPQQVNDIAQDFLLHFFGRRDNSPPRVTAYDPTRGRFRDFVCGCAKNFGIDWSEKQSALKRSNGKPVVFLNPDWMGQSVDESATPEEAFDRGWALALAELAAAKLGEQRQYKWLGKFQAHLTARQGVDREALAAELGMTVPNLRVQLNRICEHLEPLLREEIAKTETDPDYVERLIRMVFARLGLKIPRGGA